MILLWKFFGRKKREKTPHSFPSNEKPRRVEAKTTKKGCSVRMEDAQKARTGGVKGGLL